MQKYNHIKFGFALVELLVAISIFAVVVTVVYATFHTGIKAYHKTQSRLKLNQEINQVLNRMSQELRNCYSSEYDEEKDSGGFIADSQSAFFFTIYNSYSQGSFKKLLARVSYSFGDGKLFKKIQLDKNAFLDSADFQEEELISDIKEFSFKYAYFVKEKTKENYEWRDTWEDKKLIPQGIKIKIIRYDQQAGTSVELERAIFLAQGTFGFLDTGE